MRRILSFVAVAATFSALALAESWTGKLIDLTCHNRDKQASCDANSETTSFALRTETSVYKFDPAGNTKAAAAVKNRADRTDLSKPQSKEVIASVEGREDGGTITVEKIEVQ